MAILVHDYVRINRDLVYENLQKRIVDLKDLSRVIAELLRKGQDNEMVNVVRASDVEPVEMVPGVWRRTLSWGERVMAVQTTLEKGAVVPVHHHPHEQITYIVEGELSMQVEGRNYMLGVGDSLLFPANVAHGATALQRTLVVDIFSPPREDYK